MFQAVKIILFSTSILNVTNLVVSFIHKKKIRVKGTIMSTIKTKLTLLIAVMSAVAVIVALFGLQGMNESNRSLKDVYQNRIVPLEDLKIVADLYAVNIVDTSHKVRNGNITVQEAIANINDAQKGINEHWQKYASTELTEEEKRLVKEAEKLFAPADAATEKLVKLLKNNDMAGVEYFTIHHLYPNIDPISEVISKLVTLQLSESQKSYNASEEAFSSALMFNISILLIGIVVGAGLGFFTIQTILRSANEFKATMYSINQNRDLSKQISYKTNDELKMIADTFDTLILSVQEAISSAKRSASENATVAEELFSTSTQIGARSEETARSMEKTLQVSAEVSEILKRNESQSQESGEQIRQSSESVANVAKEVMEVSENLQNVVVEQMDLASRLERLSHEAEQVKQVLGVISDIAEQTNLLALNAAIEAARAGEHGRGFAVVADEVRKLAERTQKSLAESNSTVSIIVQSVSDATEMMSKSATDIKNLSERALEVEHVIQSSVNDIANVAHMALQNAQDAAEGSRKTGEVIQQMGEISSLANMNARSVEEIASAVEHLAKLTENLNSDLAKFKTA